MSAHRITGARLAQLMDRKPFGDAIVLGDFSYEAKPLRLGMLTGNHFTITLRDLDHGDEAPVTPQNGGGGGSEAPMAQPNGAEVGSTAADPASDAASTVKKGEGDSMAGGPVSGSASGISKGENGKAEGGSAAGGPASDNASVTNVNSAAASFSVVESALVGLRQRGFPNYFGLQRFGSNAAAPTHEVGAALLRSDWGEVLRLLLMPKHGDGEDELEARRIFWSTQDAAAALRVMPRRGSVERSLLEGLRDHGTNNVLQALTRLPRSLRSMYIHALQSWVWNHATSERLRRFGCERAVEGDLVLPLGTDGAEPAADTSGDASVDASGDASIDDGEVGGAPSGTIDTGGGSGGDTGGDTGATTLPEPHIVTAEEEKAGIFSIEHVVLPLPGNKVPSPTPPISIIHSRLCLTPPPHTYS